MDKLETVLLSKLWNDTLSRFNEESKTIQKANVNLAVVVNLLQSLKDYIQELRDKFEEYEAHAKIKAKQKTYNDCGKRSTQRSSRMTFFEGHQLTLSCKEVNNLKFERTLLS